MSVIATESSSESLLVLQSLLEGLVQWLAPGEEEGRDPGNLEPLLDEALNQAGLAKLHGVTEMLLIWAAAMNHRARMQAFLNDDEKSRLHVWFTDLHAYCSGELDHFGQLELLDQLSQMPKLAPLPQRLYAFLADRLGETALHIHALLEAECDVVSMPETADSIAADLRPAQDVDPDAGTFVAWSPVPALTPTDQDAFVAEDGGIVASASESAFSDCAFDAGPRAGTVNFEREYSEPAFAEVLGPELASSDVAIEPSAFASADEQPADSPADDIVFADAGFDPSGQVFVVGIDEANSISDVAFADAAFAHTMLVEAPTAILAGDEDDCDQFATQLLANDLTEDNGSDRGDNGGVPVADISGNAVHDNSPIWISPEELALALDAVGNQILPSVCALDGPQAPGAGEALLADLEFNLGLVGNAMEMLGTTELSLGILAVQACVGSAEPPSAETLVNWSTTLVAFLEQPDAESAELLGLFGCEFAGLDTAWADRLKAEAARIQVGMDPALLAQRKTLAVPEDVALDVASDVLPNVLEGMFRELPGNAERLGSSVRRLVATGDTAPIDEARRVAHTLKGDANTVGIRGLANLTHSLEDLLIELYKHPERLVPELALVLDRAADCVEEIADHLLGRGPSPDGLLNVYQAILDWCNAVVIDTLPAPEIRSRRSAERSDAEPVADPGSLASVPIDASDRRSAAPKPDAPSPITTAPSDAIAPAVAIEAQQARTATLTVSAELLDELQRLAGETLVMARQIDQRLAVLEKMHREQVAEVHNSSGLLGKLDDLITLRGAALQSTALRGGSEIDPLELDQYNELHVVSRRLLESNADNNEYQRRLDALLVEMESLRSQQETVHADLQRMVQRARTVPFDQVSGRVQRIVRQTARQLNREVELRLVGEHTLLDADLLDRVVEPLAHLLRNAIDHGIEDSSERRAAGKPETGTIQLSVATVADSIEIRVEDNGRGLDYEAIRRKAVSLGVLAEDLQVSDDELSRLILAPGFTTRQQATQVSGRGIGMDVVNQRIVDLRGQLTLSSVRGKGMSVTMRLPVSQTVANVIIAHGHGLILGAVAGSVERVQNFSVEDLGFSDDGHMRLLVDGELLEVFPIETLYGRNDGRLSIPTGNGLGLLVRSPRGKRVVISVSSIGDVSNVIVKPISTFLPPIPSVRGMTLLGDGRLAAVIDMGTLVDALDAGAHAWHLTDKMIEQVQLPRVVVADDSLSVRRALVQLMEDAGYEVSAARDGLEALELINATSPNLVLLDLEMPKLNGLEVTRFMRSRAQTRHVPVLMITSRASDKYRIQAEEAGVTMMLGKPVAEDDLIATVRKLMAESAIVVALETI